MKFQRSGVSVISNLRCMTPWKWVIHHHRFSRGNTPRRPHPLQSPPLEQAEVPRAGRWLWEARRSGDETYSIYDRSRGRGSTLSHRHSIIILSALAHSLDVRHAILRNPVATDDGAQPIVKLVHMNFPIVQWREDTVGMHRKERGKVCCSFQFSIERPCDLSFPPTWLYSQHRLLFYPLSCC